ncbi:MAG: tyrosine-type recombinase/integrase [Gemmatimonadota bacterium]|nr:tyrosine-type recombinase/integrase [Gemmatimonadota bacterium]
MQRLPSTVTPATTESGLSLDVRRLVASSISPNTRKAYEAALAAWDTWLAGREAGDEMLANYLSERHAAGVSPATIAQVVQAIRFREKLHGVAVSVVGPIADRTLAGIRREGRGRGRGQVAAIRWADVQAICRLTGTEASKAPVVATRDCALMRVMSDGLLRISEAVAVDCAHISAEMDGTGRLLIPSSKTDQTGQGAVVFLSKTTMDAVDAYRQLAGIESGPLFRRIRRGDHITEDRMSAHGARLAIQARAAAAGIEGASGHSLRVGTAQDLTAAGYGLAELQNAGRWQSPDMPGRYSRGQAAGLGAVARLRESTGD